MFILVLESSTTSAKAMYYDTVSDKYEVCARPYQPDFPGEYTFFNPNNIFEQTVTIGRELVRGRCVDIIVLCSAWHSVGLFSDKFDSATPMYQWSSNFGSEHSYLRRLDNSYVKSFYGTTGCMVNAIYPFFKLLKLSKGHDLSRLYAMGQGSYNNYRMTGELAVTDCILSGAGLMNINKLTYDENLLQEVGISISMLPPICSYKEKFALCKEAAKKLGIKAGVPVIATCSDGALNHTGSGALHEGIMTISVGTSGAIRIMSPKPILSKKQKTWCYRSPSTWLSGAATNGATNCIDWFKRIAFGEKVTYSEIERTAMKRDDYPVFLPFLYGERCPGWRDDIRGGFRNLCPKHNLYDMYLGVQEGVLFNLYQCYQDLTSERGEPEHIRLSGGILNSEAWTQMCADIFNHTMEIDECKHASLMGGVVLAKERLGIIGDIENYSLPPIRYVKPDSSKRGLYEEKYNKYLNCYEELGSNNY